MPSAAHPFRKHPTAPQQARALRSLSMPAGARAAAAGAGKPFYGDLQFSVIVCSHNGAGMLPACLGGLFANHGVTFEVIVVDNASSDGTADIVRNSFPQTRLIRAERNLGFAGGCNLGLRAAEGQCLALLHDDTQVPPDWLARLAAGFARAPKAGAIGCKVLAPSLSAATAVRERVIECAGGKLAANGAIIPLGQGEPDGEAWAKAGACELAPGPALAVRRAALNATGLLDPALAGGHELADLQLRLRERGWETRIEPAAWVYHRKAIGMGPKTGEAAYAANLARWRALALHGLPAGAPAALGAECLFFLRECIALRGGAALKAYARAARNWPAWRAERSAGRATLPRL